MMHIRRFDGLSLSGRIAVDAVESGNHFVEQAEHCASALPKFHLRRRVQGSETDHFLSMIQHLWVGWVSEYSYMVDNDELYMETENGRIPSG